MMNRYKKGELVVINGIGKLHGEENSNVIGIIKEKDYFFNEYLVEIPFGKEDWFKESDLTRVFDKEKKKTKKYKVALAIRKEGFDYITNQMKKNPEQTIDLFRQADVFQEYRVDNNVYFFILWTDTYWPETNFTVKAIEESLSNLRRGNIGYQYIKIGLTSHNEKKIKINEFIKNDDNVNIFEVLTNIKIKKFGGIIWYIKKS